MIDQGLWMLIMAVSTVLIGLFLKWLIGMWLSEREASIAAFSFALGGLPGSVLLDMHFDYETTMSKIGFAAGLAILWWALFKRKSA